MAGRFRAKSPAHPAPRKLGAPTLAWKKVALAKSLASAENHHVSLSGKKVLVTGGAGFIGSTIVEDMLNAGCEVTVYDDLSSGNIDNLCRVLRDIEFVQGSILDKQTLGKLVKGKDIVSHQAAQLEILKAMDDPGDDLITNTLGTLNVLQACARHGVMRFIAPSSAGVYGQAQFTPQTEDHPLEPQWAYGVSKLATEHYARLFAQDHGLRCTMMRYAIVYGPREWYGRVLTLFLKRALDKKPPVVFGDGQQTRDFVYVQDVVEFHRACLENDRTIGEVYNVSTSVGTTIAELASTVAEVTGIDQAPIYEAIQEGETSKHVPGRRRIPAELRTLVQCNQKAFQHTGWKPKHDLKAGLTKQWAWLSDNPELYCPELMRV